MGGMVRQLGRHFLRPVSLQKNRHVALPTRPSHEGQQTTNESN